MRSKTNAGTEPEFSVVHTDADGNVVEHRTIYSTNAPKAHRKMREMLLWEDDVFVGDVFVLLRKGREIERLVVETGEVFDPSTYSDAPKGAAVDVAA